MTSALPYSCARLTQNLMQISVEQAVCVCVCLSVCLCLSVSVSVCLCVSLCLCWCGSWGKTRLASESVSAAMQVQKKVQQLQESIRAKREDSGQRRCVCAFVTFKTEEARLKCMQANPSSVGASPEAKPTSARSHHVTHMVNVHCVRACA